MTLIRPVISTWQANTCPRCNRKIGAPLTELEAWEHPPVCHQCQTRPCEGWSAYCHECQCAKRYGRAGAGMCRCGASWQGERPCHCASCHLTFGSIYGFDAHRTAATNSCLTVSELRERGYEPNSKGYWRIPAPPGTFAGRNQDA